METDRAKAELDAIRRAGLYRRMARVSSSQGPVITLDGREVVNFSGNDSLGLADHPDLKNAIHRAVDRYGAGSGASRLVCGNMDPHHGMEEDLAGFLGRERALLFPTGYQASTGVIPILAGPDTVVLSDAHNHASLIDGIRLSRARCQVYTHNDMDALEAHLVRVPAEKPVLVVTESLFSMDGDRAPLERLVALKAVRPFELYLDEAHALGTLGPCGRGLAAACECESEVDVLMGTLGKAFGASGAFVSAGSDAVELLVNRARSLIFSTAAMPSTAAAARAALALVKEAGPLRRRLRANTTRFRGLVKEVVDEAPAGEDHIVPVPVPGPPEKVMAVSQALLKRGFFCQGIRPPAVPEDGCRLRFSLSAAHKDRHLLDVASALAASLAEQERRGS